MDQYEAINIVKEYSKLLRNHFPLEKVYLFGSYAKNNNQEDSDIDVAILVRHLKGDFFDIQPLLWKLRRQINDRIEPILIGRENDCGGFLTEIERTGIEII